MSNFLNRKKRKPTPQPEGELTFEQMAERHRTDRIKMKFGLPDGRHAIAAGPTRERVMEVMTEHYPGAELLETWV